MVAAGVPSVGAENRWEIAEEEKTGKKIRERRLENEEEWI